MQVTYSIPERIVTSAAFGRISRQQDGYRSHRAAEQLRRVAAMPSYLSDDKVFLSRLE